MKKKSENALRVALLDLINAIDEVRQAGRALPKLERKISAEMDVMQRKAHELLAAIETQN